MKRISIWRVLVLVLAAVTVLSLQAPSARAEETEGSVIFSTSVERVNPLYESGDAPAAPAAEEEPTIHTAMDFMEAATELRKIFRYRETMAVLAFPVVLESSMDDQAALEEELWLYEEMLFGAAMAHTGDPQEGDYLYFNTYQYDAQMFLTEENGVLVLAIAYNVVYHTTIEQENEMNIFLMNLINGWNLTHATDYQKVTTVYDWLCENVTYAEEITEAPNTIYSAYGAIMNGESVCQGYAAALYRMLLQVDVDCRIIDGIGNGDPHAWNIVRVGNKYYNADATWDAAQLEAGLDYTWFLTSDANFSDHQRAPEFTTEDFYAVYPMSPENYGIQIVGSGNCGDDLTWVLTDDGTFIVSGTGEMYHYGRGEAPWHNERTYLTHVYIENGATGIGSYTFWGCYNLTDITLPKGITSIGDFAFASCSRLTEAIIPEGVTDIGDSAFEWCNNMTRIEIPSSATSIGTCVFYGCLSLTEVTLPEGLTEIPEGLLNNCSQLQQITIPDGVTSIGKSAFADCDALTGIVIPVGITKIAEGTFARCDNLTKITIPESVTWIGKDAFSGCTSLESIVLPTGVTDIGAAAFSSCTSLTGITIPEGVTCISEETFYDCKSLTEVIIPEGVTEIGYNAFGYCQSLEYITIPGSVTSIGMAAFKDCSNLTSVTIGEGVTGISDEMFQQCEKLTDITIPESVAVIGSAAFENCTALPAVTIPYGVTMISNNAFNCCTALETVSLSEGLEVIGGSAFRYCTSLVQITIPATVIDISDYAFAYCEKLEKIWFLGDAPYLCMHSFYSDKLNGFYPAHKAGWEAAIAEFYGGDITWAAYGEGEETFAFTGTSVSLGDSLDIHFFLSDYEVESTDYAVITRTYADDRPDHVVTVPYGEWDDLGDGRLYITYQDIAAKEMNDTISVVVYNQDGTPASQVYTDSVKDYVMRLRRSITYDSAMEILVANLLNYGAEAQLFFGYDTENLANAELTYHDQLDASKEYLVEDHLKCSEGRAGTAITLKSRLSLDLYFENSILGDNFAEVYAVVQYTDHYGTPVEYRVEGTDFVAEDSYRSYVAVTGLAIADYRQLVTCTVYDRDGNVLAWATDSIEGYIARMDDEIPGLLAELAKLGNVAYYCFHGYIGDILETPKIIR